MSRFLNNSTMHIFKQHCCTLVSHSTLLKTSMFNATIFISSHILTTASWNAQGQRTCPKVVMQQQLTVIRTPDLSTVSATLCHHCTTMTPTMPHTPLYHNDTHHVAHTTVPQWHPPCCTHHCTTMTPTMPHTPLYHNDTHHAAQSTRVSTACPAVIHVSNSYLIINSHRSLCWLSTLIHTQSASTLIAAPFRTLAENHSSANSTCQFYLVII